MSYTNDAIFRNEKFNSKKNRENVDVDIVHSEPGEVQYDIGKNSVERVAKGHSGFNMTNNWVREKWIRDNIIPLRILNSHRKSTKLMELRNLMVIVTNKIGYTYSEEQKVFVHPLKQNCFFKIRSNELNFLAKLNELVYWMMRRKNSKIFYSSL